MLVHSWQRVPNPPIYEDPTNIAYPPFFQILFNPPFPEGPSCVFYESRRQVD